MCLYIPVCIQCIDPQAFDLHAPHNLIVLVWHSSDSKSHSHAHPTVTHSAVGPMYAMGTPIPPHHHQGNDGMTEKKKKKEEKDQEKHEKDKDKVRYY